MSDKEIAKFTSCFSESQIEYFNFFRKLTRFPGIKYIGDWLDGIDVRLIRMAPWLWHFYWAFVIQVKK